MKLQLLISIYKVKKKQKHKSKGSVRTVTKQVKADSFFNFFDPPTIPDDPKAEVDEDTQVRPIQMWWLGFLLSKPSSLWEPRYDWS